MTFWRPFCLCKLGGQDLKILLGNRIFWIQHTQIRLKSLVPNFYSKMLLTFTFPRNPTRNVEIKTNLKLLLVKNVLSLLSLINPEKNNLFYRRTGPVHFFWGAHIFWPVLPESPPALKTALSGGGGGGGTRALIFAPEICSIYSNTELGVLEIPQVLAARILDKQKTKQKQLPGFCPNSYIGTVPPPPPPFSYAYNLF